MYIFCCVIQNYLPSGCVVPFLSVLSVLLSPSIKCGYLAVKEIQKIKIYNKTNNTIVTIQSNMYKVNLWTR